MKDAAPKNKRAWMKPLPWLTLFALLCILPRHSDGDGTYQAIVDALLAGNSWGRHSLVVNLDYPPFQTLGLLMSTLLLQFQHPLHPAFMVCAFAQTMMLLNFHKVCRHSKMPMAFALPFLVLAAIPIFRQQFLEASPNWLLAAPLSGLIARLLGWKEKHDLGTLVLVSLDCGFLCLGGILPAAAGIIFAATFHRLATQEKDTAFREGTGIIIWAAPIYCVFLWLLWNWLVMGNAFYSLQGLLARCALLSRPGVSQQISFNAPQLLRMLVLLSPITILWNKSNMRHIAKSMLVLLLALFLWLIASGMMLLPATGAVQIALLLFACLITAIMKAEFAHKTSRTSCMLSMLCCLFAAFAAETITQNHRRFTPRYPKAPPKDEICSLIDKYWPDSRTMLYGERLPAIFNDPAEKRFIPKMVFREKELLAQAQNEQLHLLIPPPDGRFFPPSHPLNAIASQGKPYLLLEKQWASGWQLWRLVTPQVR